MNAQHSYERLLEIVTESGSALLARARPLLARGAQSEDESVSQVQTVSAMLECLFLGSIADGTTTNEEHEHLRDVIQTMFGDVLSSKAIGEMIRCLDVLVRNDGFETRARAASRALPSSKLREVAFELAAGVAWTDNTSESDEVEVLARLAQALELSPETSHAIVHRVRMEMGQLD